ncbi:DUF4142 domain-containing protein [Pararhizobium sp. BT-229]|uniref:DUF4142 domain-containing protein n=1 Tax=Pararhizobium sp. BT-229 TaxID=2986923 RepID=UPI0021F6D92D|nr:DUF4142 domain-containing protein [Pararhizobium sp. BT-229]MCV9966812.1 DUF4142 domain-containing protein [Pararhizobium sp. BT-229]
MPFCLNPRTTCPSFLAAIFVAVLTAMPANSDATLSARDFAQKAAMSNTFEIEAARLAFDRSKYGSVKAFAKDMIADHGVAALELAQATADELIPLPAGLDEEYQQKLRALKRTSDADFDQAYLSTQLVVHEGAVALFQNYLKEGDDGPLKTFADSALGMLRDHNGRIQALQADAGHE